MATVKTLVNFSGADGSEPLAGLVEDSAGDLFGTTTHGGANNDGTVFEVVNTQAGYAATPTTLISFNGADGSIPRASLITDGAGDLFGTASSGGTGNFGTIFEVVHGSAGYATTPTILASFAFSNGFGPEAPLLADASGNLFGTTVSGGAHFSTGTVFELAKTVAGYASAPTALVSFDVIAQPEAGLIADSAGDLFGTTVGGGTAGLGSVFEVTKTATGFSSAPTTLVSFTGPNGSAPQAGLVADHAGNLFGTTFQGGANGVGTVFEIARTASGYASTATTLVSFDNVGGPRNPEAGLIIDAAGDLFGTTDGGGSGTNARGTVFEVAKTAGGYASTATTVASFNLTDGAQPLGGVIADSAGNLFGTTETGGTNGIGTVFEITDSGFVVCFLAGTRISTPGGEVAVEHLAEGDCVLNLRGESRRIVWIGHGRVLATRGRRRAATPVIVRRGALGGNIPHRDLRVTKAHALYLDEVLIPVEFLVNHRTILWDDHTHEVELYHIELATHDVLLANGAPAESYRDDGNRWLFHNANSGWGLPPQPPCAPVHTGGPVVDAVWRRLLDLSGPRPGLPLTGDADLHLLVNGRRLDAVEGDGDAHVFRLTHRPRVLRLISRAASPQELGLARDPRPLGVALQQITVRQAGNARMMAARDARLTDGFHAFEAETQIRWTDGDAALPLDLFHGFTDDAIEITLRFAGRTTYIDHGPTVRAA